MKRRTAALVALLFLASGFALYQLSYAYFRSEEIARAEGRLSLYRSTTRAEIERFAHLAYVLSRDTFVIGAALGGDPGALNRRLEAFANRAGLDAIYLMTTDGLTIAASNHASQQSFVGQNYAFRPYFKEAMAGRQGRFYGIGATTGEPGYFIADPVRGADGHVIGVIALKLDLGGLERSWQDSGERALLANGDGVVLLASVPAWRYRTLSALTGAQRREIEAARQFAGQKLAPLDWSRHEGKSAVIGGQSQIHLTAPDLPHGWILHYFASEAPARTRAWLSVVIAAVIAAVLIVVTQQRRAARIGAALRRSEAEEAELRQANARLAVEIEDRRIAERRLERTRDELARASRLAALGELAASVTHELGQPIAAMRNHLVAAELSGARLRGVLPKISSLVDRMEGITRQLKFFSSPGDGGLEHVDLREAMREALTLVAPNLEAARVSLNTETAPGPVTVHGNRLRLEQVMTNLLRNAVDAMEEAPERQLEVSVKPDGAEAVFEVRDSGTGLGEAKLQRLQEPFFTTRASGQGMGLGLAISANIVNEHGGRMSGTNREGGGAVFTVRIPLSDGQTGEDDGAE